MIDSRAANRGIYHVGSRVYSSISVQADERLCAQVICIERPRSYIVPYVNVTIALGICSWTRNCGFPNIWPVWKDSLQIISRLLSTTALRLEDGRLRSHDRVHK